MSRTARRLSAICAPILVASGVALAVVFGRPTQFDGSGGPNVTLGEAFAPATPHVPRAVLVVPGLAYDFLTLSLLPSGAAEVIDRVRSRRL